MVAVVSNSGLFKKTIAHDKGKPAVRQGRKAVSLPNVQAFEAKCKTEDCLVAEGDPKKS